MQGTLSIRGVRGALPAPGKQFLEYGGNTSCFALSRGGGVLCFDAGSGLYGLPLEGVRRLDVLISHVHIDHILGLFALSAFRVPEIHLYGEARQGLRFARQLEAVLAKPYWPVGVRDHPSGVRIHEIARGDQFTLPWDGGDLLVRTLGGNHPDESLLYRVDLGGTSVTYALDCEMDEEMEARLA